MTRTWIYQSKDNPEIGLIIEETKANFSVWIDNYEGGEAYITDLDFLNDFESYEDAYDWIVENYGEIVEL